MSLHQSNSLNISLFVSCSGKSKISANDLNKLYKTFVLFCVDFDVCHNNNKVILYYTPVFSLSLSLLH